MNSWLITGGAGFIGSNFVRLAAARSNARLIVLDALTYAGNIANISDLVDGQQIIFIKGDIADSRIVSETLTDYGIDAVINFAAESHVDRSIEGPANFIQTNIFGTYQLLDTARLTWGDKVAEKRFLHVSTDEVYGSLGPNDPPFTEDSQFRPNSPYASSKAASDHLARAWHKTYGLPVLIGNCSNNYGPWQFPEKLIPLMILNAIESADLPIYGDGEQVRDWLHVEDHCEALLRILEAGRVGETYCIGGNNERTNIQMVHEICSSVDQALDRQPGSSRELIRHVQDRLGHDRRYAISTAKIQSELGWQPTRTLQSEIANLVDWYLEHQAWADDIRSGEYQAFYSRHYGKERQQ